MFKEENHNLIKLIKLEIEKKLNDVSDDSEYEPGEVKIKK